MSWCPASWWPFRKKSTNLEVTFLSLMRGLEHVHPIYPAKELTLPWVKESQDEVAPRLTDYSHGRIQGAAYKCSGIMGYHHKGWILSTWHDFVIDTNGDGESFISHVPSSTVNGVLQGSNAIAHFSPSLYGKLPSTPLPPNTLRGIVKLHTPWTFRITPGWGLLMAPLEYAKEHRFTSATGVINPRISQQLNPILYWHVLEGSTYVKAGTPVCRLIPIPINDQWTMTCRESTPDEYNFYFDHMLINQTRWFGNHSAVGRFYDRVILRKPREALKPWV